MNKYVLAAAAATTILAASQPASAITWVDWTSTTLPASSSTTVSGTIGAVGVTYTGTPGSIYDTQLTPAIDYYIGSAFTGFKPTNTDIIELAGGGTKTITFSSPVQDVYLALVSWNLGGTQTFDHTFSPVVIGSGYWGTGSINVLPGNSSFTADGELHGVLKFTGLINSITFNDSYELWHGITVGIGSAAPSGVPEPSTWAMMIGGFAMVGAAMRRRQKVSVRYA